MLMLRQFAHRRLTMQGGFSNGDTQALAAMWADDAIFTDQFGRVSSGRAQISAKMDSFFKANGKQPLDIKINALEFLRKILQSNMVFRM